MSFPYVLQAIYNGTDRRRGDQDIPAGQVLCRGSWVCLWVLMQPLRRALPRARPRGLLLGGGPTLTAEVPVRQKNWPAFFDLVQSEVADRDPDAFVAELQAMNIIAARASRISELRASRQPPGARLLAPRPDRRRGPRAARPAVPDEPDAGARAAGEGRCCRLRASGIVELTTAWAGPMAGRVLTWYGAESFHIESPTRTNTWRSNRDRWTPVSYPDLDPGDRPWDRVFTLQLAERQQALAGRGPQAPASASPWSAALVAVSDVLICNFRPGPVRSPRARPCAAVARATRAHRRRDAGL